MWLEVSPQLSIASKDIIAVEERDQLNSNVYTESRMFEVPMPKTVVMALIESRSKSHDSMSNVERLLTQIYSSQVTPRP